MEISPIKEHLGVEVTGVRAEQMGSADFAQHCQSLLDRHGVVVYREVFLDDDGLLALSRHLGEVVVTPTGEHRYPEIQTITLDTGRTNPILAAYRRGNFLWHFDGATDPLPQKGTLLSAREIADPGEGGTQFASTYHAYETLSADDRRLIDDLRVVHSFATAQRRVTPDPTPDDLANWSRVPEREHPLVWKRRDGRRSLLLGATAGTVVGWSADESEALLQRLLDHATRSESVVHHDWRRGDLVIWDNTGMLHRAMPFSPTSPRLMHRTTLKGVEFVA